MSKEIEECWLRWRRGERIEVLAKEYGVTRERMRYRLNKLDQTHPTMLRNAALEEAAQVADDHVFGGQGVAAAIRALKEKA